MTYENGTKVLWGCYSNEDEDHDIRSEAFIRGRTILEDRLYYVLSETEEGTHFFIRPHDWVTSETSLPEYIAAYIHEEVTKSYAWQDAYHLERWVTDAIDAYEGGAR